MYQSATTEYLKIKIKNSNSNITPIKCIANESINEIQLEMHRRLNS
jgi:hypothetical protein